MSTTRAKKGGELGANCEYYKGGQFLNTIEENAKGEARKAKLGSRKQEIEPYVWAVAPAEGLRSVYRKIAGTYGRVERDGKMVLDINPVTLSFYHDDKAAITTLCEKYNEGLRWISDRMLKELAT